MRKIALSALAFTLLGGCFNGCSRKKPEEAIEPPPPPGTAAPVLNETPNNGVQPTKPLAPDELVKRFDECWDDWNRAAWDAFKDCYTPDATLESPGAGEPASTSAQQIVDGTKLLKVAFPDMKGEPALELLHGHDLAAVTLLAGTHTGPLPGVTGMGQKVGFLMGQVLVLDEHGRTTREAAYYDQATLMGQLAPNKEHPVRPAMEKLPAPNEVVIAKDDAAEQANVAVAKRLIDAFDKHDAKAMAAVLADDSVWSEQDEPADWTKAQAIADAQATWKTFSEMNVHLAPSTMWGAGDYVVTVATMDGTNHGPMPGGKTATKTHVSLPFLAIQKIAGGKIARTWVFAQGTAMTVQPSSMPSPVSPQAAGSSAGSASAAGSATK